MPTITLTSDVTLPEGGSSQISVGDSGIIFGADSTNPQDAPFQGGHPLVAPLACVANFDVDTGYLNSAIMGTAYTKGGVGAAGVTGNAVALGTKNPVAWAFNGVVTMGGDTGAAIGQEIQVQMMGAGNGIGQIIEFGDDEQSGHGGNIYQLFRNVGNGIGQGSAANAPNYGLQFDASNFSPLKSSGSFFAVVGNAAVAAYGIDLRTVSFTEASIAVPGFTVDANGNVTAGVTNNPLVNVGRSTRNGAARISVDYWGGALNENGVTVNDVDAHATSAFLAFQSGGTQVGSITNNGNGTSYNTMSDRRLKTNIKPLFVDALSALCSLAPSTWEWRKDGSVGAGFIAQDAYRDLGPLASLLQFVRPGDDDPDARPAMPDFRAWQIDPSALIPLLVLAIQQMQKRLDAAEKRIG